MERGRLDTTVLLEGHRYWWAPFRVVGAGSGARGMGSRFPLQERQCHVPGVFRVQEAGHG